MASGFIILADGRCFAPRWYWFDAVLRAVAGQLDNDVESRALGEWLLTLVPGPDDLEDLGIGAWVRATDREVIMRHLDVRELTLENQKRFHRAVRAVGEKEYSVEQQDEDAAVRECLIEIADMAARADRGEPPLSRSHYRKVVASEGKRVGPGW